jgi:hypothetical protein
MFFIRIQSISEAYVTKLAASYYESIMSNFCIMYGRSYSKEDEAPSFEEWIGR